MKISLDSDDFSEIIGAVIAFRLRAFVAQGNAQLRPLQRPASSKTWRYAFGTPRKLLKSPARLCKWTC